MSIATDWHEGLLEAIQQFEQTRGSRPVVRVTLDPLGDEMHLQNVAPGPGEELVSLSAYPLGRLPEMVRRDDDYFTPRVVVVHVHRIARIELLLSVPNIQPFG